MSTGRPDMLEKWQNAVHRERIIRHDLHLTRMQLVLALGKLGLSKARIGQIMQINPAGRRQLEIKAQAFQKEWGEWFENAHMLNKTIRGDGINPPVRPQEGRKRGSNESNGNG